MSSTSLTNKAKAPLKQCSINKFFPGKGGVKGKKTNTVVKPSKSTEEKEIIQNATPGRLESNDKASGESETVRRPSRHETFEIQVKMHFFIFTID